MHQIILGDLYMFMHLIQTIHRTATQDALKNSRFFIIKDDKTYVGLNTIFPEGILMEPP